MGGTNVSQERVPMSPTKADAAIPEFTSGGRRKNTKEDRAPFKIDGELYYLIRPKQAILARAASALDDRVPMDDRRNFNALIGFVGEMIGFIAEQPADEDGLHGKALLHDRLNDPEDSLDLEDLLPIVQGIMNGWFQRPTGSPRGSTASRRRPPAGRGSAARTR